MNETDGIYNITHIIDMAGPTAFTFTPIKLKLKTETPLFLC